MARPRRKQPTRLPARHFCCAALAAGLVLAPCRESRADNPIVQTNYTADPAPLVHEGTIYLYTSHDEDTTVNDFFTMNDWRVYSSRDIVNWTDLGSPLRYSDFSWGRGDAWAPHGVYRNGHFYLYVPLTSRQLGRSVIGVAVSDHPAGPFTDPLDRPLITENCGDIDPNVFIDADGQAYLYWGNPNLCYVRLNEDMISYSGNPVRVQMTAQAFGARSGDADRPSLYEEGPWFYQRGDRYYLVYPAGGIPEYIAYSTSTGPTGPWTYKGVIMPTQGSSFTNHPAVVDFGGRSFFFYHNGALPGGGGYHRSVSVEEFAYGADGSIPTITMSEDGPDGVGNLNPYVRTEAETIAWESGIETEVCDAGGMDVASIDNGDYIKVKGVDFGSGALAFKVSVASATNGGSIELRLDSPSGNPIATCEVGATGGWQTWSSTTCDVSGASGVHDLFLKFTGGGGSLFNIDWWQFTAIEGGNGGAGGSGGSDAGAAGTGAAGANGGTAGSGAVGGGGQAGVAGASNGGRIGGGGAGNSGAGGPSGSGGAAAGTSGGAAAGASGTATGGAGGAGVPGSGGVAGASNAGGASAGGVPTSGASGGDAAGESESGCGCRAAPRHEGGSLALALGFALALLRRRRSDDDS